MSGSLFLRLAGQLEGVQAEKEGVAVEGESRKGTEWWEQAGGEGGKKINIQLSIVSFVDYRASRTEFLQLCNGCCDHCKVLRHLWQEGKRA